MSHFTKCDLKMTNAAAITRALDDLGLAYRAAEAGQKVKVRGYRGQTLDAAISVDMGTYDVGIVENDDGSYEVVADWWGVETTRGTTEEEFRDRLSQRYSYHQVVMACEEQGYSLEEQTDEEDGTVKLVVRKWVAGE